MPSAPRRAAATESSSSGTTKTASRELAMRSRLGSVRFAISTKPAACANAPPVMAPCRKPALARTADCVAGGQGEEDRLPRGALDRRPKCVGADSEEDVNLLLHDQLLDDLVEGELAALGVEPEVANLLGCPVARRVHRLEEAVARLVDGGVVEALDDADLDDVAAPA